MVSVSTLSTIALMIASGVVAAPWGTTSRHHTHRTRGIGPTGVQLKTYHPPSKFEGYGVNGTDHPLARRATPEEAAKSFLRSKLGVSPDGLARHSGYSFDGMSYEYFTQTISGIPIVNAVANVALKGDKVMSYGASFVKPENVASTTPLLSSMQAIVKAEEALGGNYNQWPTKLNYLATENGVFLVHVVQIQNMRSGDWMQARVDANSGDILDVVDFVADHSYEALPIQKQDISEIINEPAVADASSVGWHESKGVKTHETSGNNVVSYSVIGHNILPLSIPIFDSLLRDLFEPSKPDISPATAESSSNNSYRYKYDPLQEPWMRQNQDASRVNTFYVVNMVHDISYLYGFEENAFNFQNDNFGKGGEGNDRVQVSVLDASDVNNANFATPPDGQNGQMRIFVWTATTPMRDGGMENAIVTHEMTHGISNHDRGGWSDAMADILEAKSSPLPDFTLGSWVTNNLAGIRSHPYSINKETNTLTYGSLKDRNEVHAIGEVWANTLHGILAALIQEDGLCSLEEVKDPNSTCGQAVMLHLILDGFALQPCNPTFISARDAIIQAAANRYDDKFRCLLWEVFAANGLGMDAKTGDYTDRMAKPSNC